MKDVLTGRVDLVWALRIRRARKLQEAMCAPPGLERHPPAGEESHSGAAHRSRPPSDSRPSPRSTASPGPDAGSEVVVPFWQARLLPGPGAAGISTGR